MDFYAPWCPPCKSISPKVDQIAKANAGQIIILKVDVDEVPDVAGEENVSQMPTFKFYKNGRLLDEFRGAQPQHLEELVNSLK